MNLREDVLSFRKKYRGLIGVESKVPIKDRSVLSLVYTPGVAEPCLEIAKNPLTSFDYTIRGNTVAIVTDGSRVLGLGNMGPEAALPIMEGKSVIFKTFAGIDAMPICLDTQDLYQIIQTVSMLAPTFGAICLEDISSPRCFTIEDHLQRAVNIPVFHNDQHGAAIVVLAALYNAVKLTERELSKCRIVINGAGAAGIPVAKILLKAGVKDLVLCDSRGTLYKYRMENMNWAKAEIAKLTNPREVKGDLSKALEGADIFIGLSRGGVLTAEMVAKMAKDPIVLALSVPQPEIMPPEAKKGGAKIVATGRADFPNEVNIASVFPGVFRGLLDSRATNVNDWIVLSAARALADLVPPGQLNPDFILPKVLDFSVAPALAEAVAQAAMESEEAKIKVDPPAIGERLRRYIYEGPHSLMPKPTPKEKKMTLREEALELHARYQGTLEIKSKIPIKDQYILDLFYLPPAAAEPAIEIGNDKTKVYDYTAKGNLVAIVTDGTAVLGLGNIGPRAALPVMEGKAVLFKTFAGVEAFPICLATQNQDEIVEAVKHIAPTFGGVNLEDISAPRCFYIEERLKQEIDIPVFHDDQHGTAVVVLAGITNALRLVQRQLAQEKIIINGAGASAIAVCKILLSAGAKNITLCDTKGAIYQGRKEGMNWMKEEMALITNPERLKGSLAEVIRGAHIFIGLSVAGAMTQEMVRSMGKDPIIFAMANPTPEIMPDLAKEAGAGVVATGRSDFDNQVNNSLAFPGIFRGALDTRARHINDAMKIAAAYAIADLIPQKDLRPEYIIPSAMDFRIPPAVAKATAMAAIETGEARHIIDPETVAERTREFIYEGTLPEEE